MKDMKKIISISLVIALAFWIGFNLRNVEKAEAVAGQLSATIATSSTITVSTASVVAFATSTNNCSIRIVTTNADPVRFEFTDIDGFTLSSAVGHTQLASTTVAYDASVYGCAQWRVINAGPQGNTAIFQVSEAR